MIGSPQDADQKVVLGRIEIRSRLGDIEIVL